MPKKAQGKNDARLSEDIKRELIDIISNMKDPRLKVGLITVTHVAATADLAQCKVYVSVMCEKAAAKAAFDALAAAKGHVRSEIARRMHIRKSPEFVFIADDSAAYAQHINKLLNELK